MNMILVIISLFSLYNNSNKKENNSILFKCESNEDKFYN